MKALFSTQQKDSKASYKGKTAVGIMFSIAITGAFVAGMTQQTGNSPSHWSTGSTQVAQSAVVATQHSAAARPIQLAAK
jgi:hypothetical protein